MKDPWTKHDTVWCTGGEGMATDHLTPLRVLLSTSTQNPLLIERHHKNHTGHKGRSRLQIVWPHDAAAILGCPKHSLCKQPPQNITPTRAPGVVAGRPTRIIMRAAAILICPKPTLAEKSPQTHHTRVNTRGGGRGRRPSGHMARAAGVLGRPKPKANERSPQNTTGTSRP